MKLPILLFFGAAGLLGYYLFRQGGLPTESVTRPVATPKGASVQMYTVQPGDSLSKIADKFEISYKTLLILNPQFTSGQRDPNVINVGESIRVS